MTIRGLYPDAADTDGDRSSALDSLAFSGVPLEVGTNGLEILAREGPAVKSDDAVFGRRRDVADALVQTEDAFASTAS